MPFSGDGLVEPCVPDSNNSNHENIELFYTLDGSKKPGEGILKGVSFDQNDSLNYFNGDLTLREEGVYDVNDMMDLGGFNSSFVVINLQPVYNHYGIYFRFYVKT